MEQNLISSPKQASLSPRRLVHLAAFVNNTEGKWTLSKSSDSFFSSNKIHKRFRHDPNNLHLKYACPTPSPEMTFKLCLGNMLGASCHGPLWRTPKTWGREMNIETVSYFRDLWGSKWNSLLLPDTPLGKETLSESSKFCVSRGCGGWNECAGDPGVSHLGSFKTGFLDLRAIDILGWSFFTVGCLCTAGCFAASLVSAH